MSMIDTVKTAIKNPAYRSVATYIFTNFFSKGVSFILIPLFTNPKYLTPTDNGLLSLFSSNMILLAPFITLGMIQSSAADYFKKSKEDFAASLTGNFFIGAILALLATLLLFIFQGTLREKFDFPASFVYILPGLAFLTFTGELLFALIRNRNEVNNYAATGISKSVIEYSVSVILIVFFFTGWMGRIWGIAISLIAVNLYSIWYYTRNGYINFSFQISHVWEEIKFGVPVLIFQLCVFMLGATNKLFLAIFNVDKHDLGIYAIASILGAMMGTIAQSILLYVQPQLYKSLSEGDTSTASLKRHFFRYLKLLCFFAAICVGIVVFCYYFLINKIYLSGLPYFFIVAASSFIWALNYFLFLFLLYYKKKKTILMVALISITCSITVNIILVKNYLILGDALSGLVNTLIFSGIIIVVVRKLIKNNFGNSSIKNTVTT